MSRTSLVASVISLGFSFSAPAAAQTAPTQPSASEAAQPSAAQPSTAQPSTAAQPVAGLPPAEPAPDAPPSADNGSSPQEGPSPATSEGDATVDGAAAEEPAATPSPEKEETNQIATEEAKPPYDGPATLLDSDDEKMHIGGYGGLVILGTSIHNSGGLLLGGEGALLLDHRFAIGLAGYGLSSEVRGPDFANGDDSILGFGYGGAVFRYHLISKRSPVTASVGSLIGAGGLTLIQKVEGEDFDYEYDYPEDTPANAFFVAEPSVQVNLHLTKWMRFGASGGYRIVRGPNLRGVSDRDLEGITAGGHAEFGWF